MKTNKQNKQKTAGLITLNLQQYVHHSIIRDWSCNSKCYIQNVEVNNNKENTWL